MANTYNSEFQSNNVDLQSILDIINSLPSAGASSGTMVGGYSLLKVSTVTMDDTGNLDISGLTQEGNISVIIAISNDWSFTALWNDDSGYFDCIVDSSYLTEKRQIEDNEYWPLDGGFFKFASGATFYLIGFGN